MFKAVCWEVFLGVWKRGFVARGILRTPEPIQKNTLLFGEYHIYDFGFCQVWGNATVKLNSYVFAYRTNAMNPCQTLRGVFPRNVIANKLRPGACLPQLDMAEGSCIVVVDSSAIYIVLVVVSQSQGFHEAMALRITEKYKYCKILALTGAISF